MASIRALEQGISSTNFAFSGKFATMIHVQVFLIATALVTTVVGFPSTPSKTRIVSRVELNQSYDYIVVGGGTSGLTIADRLTEDPRSTYGYPSTNTRDLFISKETVLIIESGQLDEGEDYFRIPGALYSTPPKYFYNLTSTPQPATGNQTYALQAGFFVGGGSAVNGMFFDRG